jgi:Protein of unknown function (DUF3052)
MKQAGYSKTPLLQKLGVREGSRIAVMNAPEDFVHSLPELPVGATLRQRGTSEADVIVWFIMSSRDLDSMASAMKRMPPDSGMLWVAWPKKASKVATDLTEDVIRGAAIRAGLVDTKVCAIDETWSGLRLSRRKASAT